MCELPYCFCDYRGWRNGSLKAKKAEGGDTPERLRASSSALPAPSRQQMSAVAPSRLALAGPGHRRQSSEGIRGGYKCQFGPGFPYRIARLITVLVCAHLPPPFRFCASLLLPGCCRSAALHGSVYSGDTVRCTVSSPQVSFVFVKTIIKKYQPLNKINENKYIIINTFY